jgi:hypothetical protein
MVGANGVSIGKSDRRLRSGGEPAGLHAHFHRDRNFPALHPIPQTGHELDRHRRLAAYDPDAHSQPAQVARSKTEPAPCSSLPVTFAISHQIHRHGIQFRKPLSRP